MLGDAGQRIGTAVKDTVDEVTQKAEEGLDKAEAQLSGTPA